MRLIHPVHFINQSAIQQPLNRNFKVCASCSFFNLTKKEFFIFFRKLHWNGIPNHSDSRQCFGIDMFSKIAFILTNDFTLNSANFSIILFYTKGLYNGWHSSGIIIIFQPEQILFRKNIDKWICGRSFSPLPPCIDRAVPLSFQRLSRYYHAQFYYRGRWPNLQVISDKFFAIFLPFSFFCAGAQLLNSVFSAAPAAPA